MSCIGNLGSQFGPLFYGVLSKTIMNPNDHNANIIMIEGNRNVRYFDNVISERLTVFFAAIAIWSTVIAIVIPPIVPNPDGMVSLVYTYIANLFIRDNSKKKSLKSTREDNENVLRKSIESMRSSFSSAMSSHSSSHYSYVEESRRNYNEKIRARKSMTSETSISSKITEKISKRTEFSIKKSELSILSKPLSKKEDLTHKDNYELKDMLLDYIKYDKEDPDFSVYGDNEDYQQKAKRSNTKVTDSDLSSIYSNDKQ